MDKEVLLTFEKLGYIKLSALRSTLLKTIPVSGSDGLILTFTSCPLWRPTPLKLIVSLMVF